MRRKPYTPVGMIHRLNQQSHDCLERVFLLNEPEGAVLPGSCRDARAVCLGTCLVTRSCRRAMAR
jgi:hypothetical protein